MAKKWTLVVTLNFKDIGIGIYYLLTKLLLTRK